MPGVKLPRRLRFFRVLLSGFQSKLPLPSAIVGYFAEEKSPRATLLSPLGKSWHVEVEGDGKKLSFTDGWQKFAADHELRIGDFLVFKHKGGLMFDVSIFDTSTCERNYDPITTNASTKEKKSPSEVNNCDGDNDPVATTNGFTEYRIPTEEDRSEKASGGSTRQTTSSHGKDVDEEMLEQDAGKCEPAVAEECRTQSRDHSPSKRLNRQEGKHLQFVVVMKKHHHRTFLNLPVRVGASNVLSSIHQLSLRDPNGQLWPVLLSHCKKGSLISKRIYAGWQQFCAGNNLEEGDCCVFELKGSNKLLVQIHRVKDTSGKRKQTSTGLAKQVVQSRTRQAVKRLKRVVDEKASESTGTCSSGSQYMSNIVPSNLTFNCDRNYDPIATTNGFTGYRSAGVVNNSPTKEDKSEKASRGSTRQTKSSHAKDVVEETLEQDARKCGPAVKKCRAQGRNHSPSTRSNQHERKPHQFVVVMKKHHHRGFLDLPARVRASSVLSGIRRLYLRDPNGQLWPTTLCHGRKGSLISTRICAGWQQFCAGNNLEEGDFCVFELKGNDELLVQINRRGGPKSMRSAANANRVKETNRKRNQAPLLAKPVVQSRTGQAVKRVKGVVDGTAPESIGISSPGRQFVSNIVRSGLFLNVPTTFLKLVDLSALQRVVLVDAKSRRWPVKLYHWKAGSHDRVRLQRGWTAFCRKNNVQVGDACVFKLTTRARNDVFHVEVVRSPRMEAQ